MIAMTKENLKNVLTVVRNMIRRSSDIGMRKAQSAEERAHKAQITADAAKATADAAQSTAEAAQSTAEAAQSTADAAKATADSAPFVKADLNKDAIYNKKSHSSGTYIDLSGPNELAGSGYYKVSDDLYDASRIKKIAYTIKYSSGAISDVITKDDISSIVYAEEDKSVFLYNNVFLVCKKTGTFHITVNTGRHTVIVSETGLYLKTFSFSNSYSFVNYLKITHSYDVAKSVYSDILLPSSTAGSSKQFRITVDDTGTLSATEVTDTTT